MESYATALNIAIPAFMGLILLEMLAGRMMGRTTFRVMDTVSSLSSGITNITKDVLGLALFIGAYAWLQPKIEVFDLKATWATYLLAFVGKDFAGYWIHRFEHRVNYFWNRHLIHHSSEEFNLPCALRQSISEIVSYSFVFLLPIAILGVPVEVYAVIAPIHLFAQFWYHTTLIGRMGPLEHILVTPSHHRVHHAINPEYIDKNFSQIFIIWDKLFGTFQEEMDDVPPVYGIKRAVRTWNPILINFQHAWLVIRDFWRTKSWRDKARIWFMPTGWRPADVAEKYPVEVTEDPYTQEKYDPPASTALKIWAGVQLASVLVMAIYLFNRLPDIPYTASLGFGGLLFLSVFAYTSLMDRTTWAWIADVVRAGIVLGIVMATGDFFLLGQIWPAGPIVVAAFFVGSALASLGFTLFEFRGDRDTLNVKKA